MEKPLIAHEDDPKQLEWLFNAAEHGGSFISHFARAAMVADRSNYPVLQPLVKEFRQKYPAYDPETTQFIGGPRHEQWMTAEHWMYVAMVIRNEIKQPIARNGAILPEGMQEFLSALFDYAEHKSRQ